MKTEQAGSHTSTNGTAERRAGRRYAVSRIQASIRPHDVPITLVNISDGGFLMRCSTNHIVGDIHKFRFIVEGEREGIFVLRGRVIHTMRMTANGQVSYLVGVEFLDREVPASEHALARLVGASQ